VGVRGGGGFNALHMIATDSSGNLYTGEVDPNNRVQRFVVKKIRDPLRVLSSERQPESELRRVAWMPPRSLG